MDLGPIAFLLIARLLAPCYNFVMTTPANYRDTLADFVRLVERCPVTSDADWIAQRNELLVGARAFLAAPEAVGVADEAQAAIDEFRYQAGKYCADPSAGTCYALKMAAEECRLLGIDPSSITLTGLAHPAPETVEVQGPSNDFSAGFKEASRP